MLSIQPSHSLLTVRYHELFDSVPRDRTSFYPFLPKILALIKWEGLETPFLWEFFKKKKNQKNSTKRKISFNLNLAHKMPPRLNTSEYNSWKLNLSRVHTSPYHIIPTKMQWIVNKRKPRSNDFSRSLINTYLTE